MVQDVPYVHSSKLLGETGGKVCVGSLDCVGFVLELYCVVYIHFKIERKSIFLSVYTQ